MSKAHGYVAIEEHQLAGVRGGELSFPELGAFALGGALFGALRNRTRPVGPRTGAVIWGAGTTLMDVAFQKMRRQP